METTSDQTREWLKSGDSREYFELVAFPTVAADPARLRDCVACATWLKKWLKGIGAEAELVLPPQRGVSEEKVAALSVPVVFAELKGTEGAPTLLFYGHYDVQPADPLEQWETPPFEPTPRGDRVYARGAQDDKGQFFAFLCGLREFWREAGADGRARPNVKILLEGQEESGSTGLFRLLGEPEFRRRIAADVMLVCDTSAASDLRPAIVAGMRGVCHFTVRLEAASRDLAPQLLTAYALSLAGTFHAFYNTNRILGEESDVELGRLKIASATRMVLASCLGLLGIGAPERM